MKSKVQTKKLYCVFNLLFGILVLFFLGINIKKISVEELKLNTTIAYIIQVFGVAVFVHAIKALRLYIVLFGNKFSFRKYLGQYIKTAAVNLLLPFKCGEIYRGLCIGELIGTYAEGYIIVIFDRFVDTLALITMVILAGFLFGFEITYTYLALTVFLLLMIVIYWLFIPLYQYWNHFLVFRKTSEHTLKGLQFLDICKKAFGHINEIVKGRFIILYLLSLLAWGIEIGYFLIFSRTTGKVDISTYLSDVLTGTLNSNNVIYMMACLTLFLLCGVALGIIDISKKEGK